MTLIIQWVRISFGFSTQGGKVEAPTDASCELLLIAVPTPPTSDNTCPPWQMDDLSFADIWGFALQDGKPEAISSTDAAVNELARAMEEVADHPNPLPASSLEKAVAAADTFTSSTIAAYEESVRAMPSPPFTQEPTTLLRGDPTQISAAKMYALDLSGSDIAYLTGNTATKVQIALGLAAQELEGWRMFRVMAERTFKGWEDQINRLEAFRELLQTQKNDAAEYVDKARDVHQRVVTLEQETEGVRQYHFANEALGGRHQHMSTFPPTYLSGRTMQHMSSGQGYFTPLSGSGQYPMYNPQISQPLSQHPYDGLVRFPHHPAYPSNQFYPKRLPLVENTFEAPTKSMVEKEPGISSNEISGTSTANTEREVSAGLLPSKVLTSASSVSTVSQADGVGTELEDGQRNDDDDLSLPGALTKSGTDSEDRRDPFSQS